MSFGKSSYSDKKEFKKKNHFDLKNGDLVARILPPFGSQQDNPKGWHVYHTVHFGYKNSEGKHRPFESPEVTRFNNETKTKVVEVRDAALDRLNDLKAKLEEAEKSGNKPMAEKLGKLVGFMGTYNVDKNHHLNVVLLDGSAGELKLRHKAFLALQEEIRKLDAEGTDPLSLDNGRFFVFSRSGKGNETNFKVSIYKQKIEAIVNGKSKLVEEDVVSTLGHEVLKRIETELFDLGTLFERPTAEEVAKIVESSDLMTGKSPVCDEIFDARWKLKRGMSAKETTSAPLADSASTTKIVAPLNTSTTSGLDRLVEDRIASRVVVAPVTASLTSSSEEMSDEDFFRAIGEGV